MSGDPKLAVISIISAVYRGDKKINVHFAKGLDK